MTVRSRIAELARYSMAFALVAALVFVVPAYGIGTSDSAQGTPAPAVETPAQPPADDSTDTKASVAPPLVIVPGSSTLSRPAPEPSVIGDPGVDPNTQRFRAQLAQRQAQLDAFIAQLDELDRELSIASESYNEAADRLGSMNKQVHTAELDLASANESYDVVSGIMDNQLGTMYRSGTYASVEILLDAKSLGDFLSRLKFLNTVGTDTAEVLKEYSERQAELEQQVFKLRNAKRLAESLEFELKARKIEVQLRIVERQQLFAATQSDLLSFLSIEATRRQQEEAALLKEILAGVSKAGVRVEPGSPVETVLAYHGVPYLWGGATPAGFDCSGLVLYVMRQHGVELPHYSGSQFLLGEKISPVELQPGDVVFFGSPIHHVGMYIGGGYFAHAPRTGDYVKISLLADRSDYAGARRYAWQRRLLSIQTAITSPAAALTSVE